MSGQIVDPDHLASWLSSEPVEDLALIEDVFRGVSEGLPFERVDGDLMGGLANGPRWVAGAIATIIRDYRETGWPMFDEFVRLSEMVDAAMSEMEIRRLEAAWLL